jgi:hypothetical protein
MAQLKIKQLGITIERFNMESVKQAVKFVADCNYPSDNKFIFSTFNKAGIENTINIQKR